MLEDEKLASPPPSLVPRLHCIRLEKLEPTNPLLAGVPTVAPVDFNEARGMILSALSNALGGDMLAAEYVLVQLLSSV